MVWLAPDYRGLLEIQIELLFHQLFTRRVTMEGLQDSVVTIPSSCEELVT